ncbi:hypothetical protein WL80_09760 [Burkholderia ubonensis]|nr:hypothetical protein WL80_09760 [Burkholderia ubonensis]
MFVKLPPSTVTPFGFARITFAREPRTLRLSWIIDGFVLVTWLTIVRALMPMLFRSAPAFETLNDVRNAADGGRDIDGLATA